MRFANILTIIAIVIWLSLLFIGLSMLNGVAEQGVSGHPSSQQIRWFVVQPAIVVLILLACGWALNRKDGWPTLLGWLSAVALFAALFHFMSLGGGV